MVSVGVIMECFALGHSIREGAKLEDRVSILNERASAAQKSAGEANERAANAELSLEKLKQWRTITAEQKSDFTNLTHSLQKFPIMIRMGAYANSEIKSFAIKIRDMLDAGGFAEPDPDRAISEWPPELNFLYNGGMAMPSVVFVENILQMGAPVDLQEAKLTIVSLPNYSTSAPTRAILFLTNTSSEQKAFAVNDGGQPTLVIPVPAAGYFKKTAFMEVQKAFEKLGFTAQAVTSTNIPEDACEIFINPK